MEALRASLWKDTVQQHSRECGCSGILLQLLLLVAPHPSVWEKAKQFQMHYFSRLCLSNLYALQYQIKWLIVTLGQFIEMDNTKASNPNHSMIPVKHQMWEPQNSLRLSAPKKSNFSLYLDGKGTRKSEISICVHLFLGATFSISH